MKYQNKRINTFFQKILLSISFAMMCMNVGAAALTVTNNSDDDGFGDCLIGGNCSLRQAINSANDNGVPDTINFSTDMVIEPLTQLPPIIDETHIVGKDPYGALLNVVLEGTTVANNADIGRGPCKGPPSDFGAWARVGAGFDFVTHVKDAPDADASDSSVEYLTLQNFCLAISLAAQSKVGQQNPVGCDFGPSSLGPAWPDGSYINNVKVEHNVFINNIGNGHLDTCRTENVLVENNTFIDSGDAFKEPIASALSRGMVIKDNIFDATNVNPSVETNRANEFLPMENVTIVDNLYLNFHVGIRAIIANHPNNLIDGNTFLGVSRAISIQGNGVFIPGRIGLTDSVISNNDIIGGVADNFGFFGISLVVINADVANQNNIIENNIIDGLGYGIRLVGSNGNTIRSNVIKNSESIGVFLQNRPASLPNSFTTITDNQIIVDEGMLGHAIAGVYMEGHDSLVSNNVIKGSSVGSSNGILVAEGTNHTLIENSISENNGGLGIDLGVDGVTFNDTKDPDIGANNLQNYPVLNQVGFNPAVAFIKGSLNSTPKSLFRLDFYSSKDANVSGYGEGESWLGYKIVKTDDDGNVEFEVPYNNMNASGFVFNGSGESYLTATATSISSCDDNMGFGGSNCKYDNTSEFSLACKITQADLDNQTSVNCAE